MDLTKKESYPVNINGSANPFDWTDKGQKKGTEGSPEGFMPKKKRNIKDWQIAEFLYAFIEGTAIQPRYGKAHWLEHEVETEFEPVTTGDKEEKDKMESDSPDNEAE